MRRLPLLLAALALAACGADELDTAAGPTAELTALRAEERAHAQAVADAVEAERVRLEQEAQAADAERVRLEELAAARAARKAAAARTRAGVGAGSRRPPTDAELAALRQCEATGNYHNRKNRTYRGAYQFDRQTWESVGGSGDPADAPPSEQDDRARTLWTQRDAWPNC